MFAHRPSPPPRLLRFDPATQMKVNTLTLAKGATLAMNPPYQHAHPPSLVEVQTLLNRAPPPMQMTKVPSLLELNARIASPAGLKVAPPAVSVPAAAITPLAPTAANAAAPPQDDAEPVPCAGKVCANCLTQKTPLWRNGPLGPKTLCNACGVRYKLGKLPPPGGWPPGHVPPPPPPRKRPAQMLAGDKAKRPKGAAAGDKGPEGKKKRRKNTVAPDSEYLKAHFGNGTVLSDYDGAVLLMVLSGMYSH